MFVRGADYEQTEEADQQNHELRRHHIRQDRAHKKPILALEKRVALRAVVPDVKRVRDDLRAPASGAAQPQTAIQYPFYFFRIFLHGPAHILPPGTTNGKPGKA